MKLFKTLMSKYKLQINYLIFGAVTTIVNIISYFLFYNILATNHQQNAKGEGVELSHRTKKIQRGNLLFKLQKIAIEKSVSGKHGIGGNDLFSAAFCATYLHTLLGDLHLVV